MSNQELSQIFREMAEIYRLKGLVKDRFRIRAYYNVAQLIKNLTLEITEKQDVKNISGIGRHLADKISEYLKTGQIKQHQVLKKDFPSDLLNLLNIKSLGPKRLKQLIDIFNIKNLKDLKDILNNKLLLKIENFGEKTIQNIKDGVKNFEKSSGRHLLGEVYLVVQELINYLIKNKLVIKVAPAGSVRRYSETIGDIDLLVASSYGKEVIDYFCEFPLVQKILAQGETKGSVLLTTDWQVDLRVVKNGEWGSALLYFTGSKQHNICLRTLAKAQGFKINEYGIFKEEQLLAAKTEQDVYKVLGMEYIPPEIRENRGEIELSQKNQLPNLVLLKNINGDLHIHSNYSEGQKSILELVKEAERRNYNYLAFTDHFISSQADKNLLVGELKKKL